jgi:hypothetical protein
MLFDGGSERRQPTMVKATCWFDTPAAERFTVSEQTFALPNNRIVALIGLTDRRMLEF